MKFLYLLALFQLVAGPLVLLNVTAFSKLVICETARSGVVVAAQEAWESNEFPAAAQMPDAVKKEGEKSPLSCPDSESKAKVEKQKMPWLAWSAAPLRASGMFELVPCADWARNWTPMLAQPPPGPPPRVG